MTSAKITARLFELIEEKRQQLAESQNSMNRLFTDLDKLEARLENNNNNENEDLTFEAEPNSITDVQRLDLGEVYLADQNRQSRSRSPLTPPPQHSKADEQQAQA
ncbi:hypothetical protein QAD02_009611 [Eretmocerus hayati]|uniref:Uncharacterized protein n=1 Tax=Eretmocerus hayati TaxID=131215 RepID=A0ACC2NAI8_9HYME|nr:hypothetical protein QAD02_009611 [Eretmocerus hayati]